jgi:hypothetical protein
LPAACSMEANGGKNRDPGVPTSQVTVIGRLTSTRSTRTGLPNVIVAAAEDAVVVEIRNAPGTSRRTAVATAARRRTAAPFALVKRVSSPNRQRRGRGRHPRGSHVLWPAGWSLEAPGCHCVIGNMVSDHLAGLVSMHSLMSRAASGHDTRPSVCVPVWTTIRGHERGCCEDRRVGRGRCGDSGLLVVSAADVRADPIVGVAASVGW